MATITIFLSYRRDDTLESTAHLFRSLQRHYTKDELFFDVYRESPGATLPDKLAEFVRDSEALIAVIGRAWEQRLGNEWDAVRYELEIALASRVPVFPVLVQGASMPAPHQFPEVIRVLSQCEALTLRALEFDADVDRLIAAVETTRNRRKHEAILTEKMEAAAAGSKYTEAIQIAESIVPLARDRDAISRRLMQLRLERQHRLNETSGAAAESDRELAAGRIESALAMSEDALSLLPDEPDYLRLNERIQASKKLSEQRERDGHLRKLMDSTSQAAKKGPITEFARFAQRVIEAGGLLHPEFQKLLHAERFRLRQALLRNPRDAAVRQVYLQSRDEQLKQRDRMRKRIVLASAGILTLYGSWAILALVLWRWFLNGEVTSSIVRGTIPMFAIAWIMAMKMTPSGPSDEYADTSGSSGCLGCLVFVVPATLIFLFANGLDVLLIPIYALAAAWLIKNFSEPTESSDDGPMPIWRYLL